MTASNAPTEFRPRSRRMAAGIRRQHRTAAWATTILLSWGIAAQSLRGNEAVIRVNETLVAHPALSKNLLGYNNNWYQQNVMLETDRVTFRPEFEALYSRCSHNLQRMSGTAAMYLDWKKAIVMPPTVREAQTNQYGGKYTPWFGPVEWIQETRKYNTNAVFTWTLNLKGMSPQDHADLAEFFLYDGTNNPNDGMDWRQKRIDLGLGERPLRLGFFELGNEMDRGGHTVEEYVSLCRAAIDAVRAVIPDAKFAAQAACAPWGYSTDWRVWHRSILQSLSQDIQYIAFHPYYQGIAIANIEQTYIEPILADMRNPAYSQNLNMEMAITEHAVWASEGQTKHVNLRGCLHMAHFLARMTQRPEISHAMYHGMVVGRWGVIQPDDSEQRARYKTGNFDVMEVLTEAVDLGAVTVQSTVEGPLTDWKDKDATLIHSVLRRTDGGLNVILVNKGGSTPRDIGFTFNGRYRLARQVVLTAENMEDFNTETNTPIFVTRTGIHDTVEFNAYRLDAKSLAILSLEADADMDGMPDAWEAANGLDAQNPADAGSDADGDGMSNVKEYIAGTNPRDGGSRLEIQYPKTEGGVFRFRFLTVTGRMYGVEGKENLSIPDPWAVVANPIEGTGGYVEMADTILSAKKFYRITVQLQ